MNAACGTAWHHVIERKVVSIIECFLHLAGNRQAWPGVTNGRGARTDTSALAMICLARTVSAVLLLRHLSHFLALDGFKQYSSSRRGERNSSMTVQLS